LDFLRDFVQQVSGLHLDDVDFTLEDLHVHEVQMVVLLELHGVIQRAQIRNQRPDESHVALGHRQVELEKEVEAEELLPPHVVQQSNHPTVSGGGCIELALQLELEEVHVIHILVLEAVRVHNDVQQIQDITRGLLRLLA
jgi:hypothetical protein